MTDEKWEGKHVLEGQGQCSVWAEGGEEAQRAWPWPDLVLPVRDQEQALASSW